jgi:hypothetical protein
MGLFQGRRNQPVKLNDPHPIEKFDDAVHTGSPAHDGFTRLSRASPRRQGDPPPVSGAIGPAPMGPDTSFEQ